MKRKLLFLLMALFTVCAMGQDGELEPLGYLTLNRSTQNGMSIEETGDYEYHIVSLNGDPYIQTSRLPRDLTDEEIWVAMEYKSPQTINNAEFFFSPIAAGREQVFAFTLTEEWTAKYVNIAASRQKFGWGKKNDNLRLDTGEQPNLEVFVRNIEIISQEEYDKRHIVDVGTINLTQDSEGYWIISTPADLKEFSRIVNSGMYRTANAKLTADLDMSEVTDFCPIGVIDNGDSYSKGAALSNLGFAGTFEGQKHVIRNLTAPYNPSYGASGVFGLVTGTVRDLGIDNYVFDFGEKDPYSGRFAALAGQLVEGRIENCWVTGSTVIHPNEIVAALVAGNYGGTVSRCWEFSNDIQAYSRAGRLVGDPADDNGVRRGTQEYCVSEGAVAGTYTSTLIDCYSDMPTDAFLSGEVTFRLNGDQKEIVWYQTIGEDNLPTMDSSRGKVFAQGEFNCDGSAKEGEITYTNTPNEVVIPDHVYEYGICVNCGHEVPGFMSTDADGFYHIQWYTQLLKFSELVNSGQTSIKAKLDNDIDMTPVENFTPIGLYTDEAGFTNTSFSGVFDGQNHIIYNLKVTRDDSREVGFFSRTYAATLMNLGIVNAEMTSNASVRTGVLGGELHVTTVTNCFTAGNLLLSTEDEQMGGISGEAASANLSNCWSTYEGPLTAGASSMNNCFENCAEIAASGELCYTLNGKTFLNPTWYQTIGEDAYPTWDKTHSRVYQLPDGSYASLTTENFASFRDDVVLTEMDWSSEYPYSAALQEEYEAMVGALSDISVLADFLDAYETLYAKKALVQTSMDAYAAYMGKVEEVKAYLEANPDMAGAGREVVESYLNDDVEPGDAFPNGSYSYIDKNRQLSTEEIQEETIYLENLLTQAIASDYTPGSEITNLMVNPDFSLAKEGWETNAGSFSTYDTPASELKHIAGSTNAVDLSQTLTGMKDGIYELTVKANYRPFGDNNSLNYASFVYANDVQTYTRTIIEDYVPLEAEYADETNFTVLFEDGSDVGYAPALVQGHAFAFSDGLYENRIVVNVTDGNLTVGVRTPGVNGANVTRLGDFHLYYQGDMESATAIEALDRTLNEMAVTADHLLNVYVFMDDETYNQFPNYPLSLKVALENAVAAIPNASTGAEKYALVQQIGNLFQQIYEGKQAYVNLLDVVEAVYSEYSIADYEGDDKDAVNEISARVWGCYDEDPLYPEISTEEAIAMAADIKATYACYMTLTSSGAHNMEWTNIAPFSYFITTVGPDPYAYLSSLEYDVTNERYLYFQYQTETAHNAEIFYSPIVAGNEIWFDFEATADGEWKDMFIDLNDAFGIDWGKAGDRLRLDPIPDDLTTLCIRHIRLVSEEQKQDILNGGSSISDVVSSLPTLKATGIYDLTGRKFANRQQLKKGLYIINGKKQLVK